LTGALKTLNFKPEIDLFASRLNKQLPVYCSYRPDPGASFINAFTFPWANKKLYRFPPFSCILQVLQKIIQDQATCVVVVPDWPTQAWYPLLTSLLVLPPVKLRPSKNLLRLPATPATVHPLHKNVSLYLLTVQQQLTGLGFTERSIKVITASWREGTTAQYQSHLKRWIQFCKEKKCSILSPDLTVVLYFLTMLHENGLSYSSVNTARSMLSSILQLNINSSVPFGQLPLVKRFMKGIYELRPSLPRYTATWDLSSVLNYFRKSASVSALSLTEDALKSR